MAVAVAAEMSAAAPVDAASEAGVAPPKERGVPETDRAACVAGATALAAAATAAEAAFRAPVGLEAAVARLRATGVPSPAAGCIVGARRAVSPPEDRLP